MESGLPWGRLVYLGSIRHLPRNWSVGSPPWTYIFRNHQTPLDETDTDPSRIPNTQMSYWCPHLLGRRVCAIKKRGDRCQWLSLSWQAYFSFSMLVVYLSVPRSFSTLNKLSYRTSCSMRCEVEFQLLKKGSNSSEFITLSWRTLRIIHWWSKSIYWILFIWNGDLFFFGDWRSDRFEWDRGEEQTKIRNDKHMARSMITQEVAGKVSSLFLPVTFPQNFTYTLFSETLPSRITRI